MFNKRRDSQLRNALLNIYDDMGEDGMQKVIYQMYTQNHAAELILRLEPESRLALRASIDEMYYEYYRSYGGRSRKEAFMVILGYLANQLFDLIEEDEIPPPDEWKNVLAQNFELYGGMLEANVCQIYRLLGADD